MIVVHDYHTNKFTINLSKNAEFPGIVLWLSCVQMYVCRGVYVSANKDIEDEKKVPAEGNYHCSVRTSFSLWRSDDV